MRDERIRALHLNAVKKAFSYMQSLARVRDRRGELVRSEFMRPTESLAAGLFLHESSRANNPNLHVHTVLANLTFDREREGWMALQAAEMYRQRKLLDKIALAELAHGLRGLGYELERTEHAFEVQGVGSDLIERFSQRRVQVQRLAEELRADSTRLTLLYVKYKLRSRFDVLAPDEKASVRRAVGSLTDAEVRELATLETRPEKEAKTRRELLDLMNQQLSEADSRRLDEIINHAAVSGSRERTAADSPTLAATAALRYALDHELERASAVSEPRLLETLLHHGTGSVRLDEAQAALEDGPVIRLEGSAQRRFITTQTVLAEEKAVVDYVRRTRGTCRQLDPRSEYQPLNVHLSEEQILAVNHVRSSRDRIIAIRGIAGTGKTTLLRESIHALNEAGHQVFLFAPSSEASRGVLRKEAAGVAGNSPAVERIRSTFRSAETVEKLLTDPAVQASAAGHVIWIDEAGLLSMPAMDRVFDLAERLRCRVVLAGDVAQHTAVERGDALRVLEKHAGLKPAELSVVRRQRLVAYQRVVEAFASGDVERGCRRLRKLGAWREITGDGDRYEQLGRDYAELVAHGKEVLAISPTHAEGDRVVQAVRAQLRADGVLTGEEQSIERLVNLHFTTAQKTVSTSYRTGQLVQFVRRTGMFAPGERAVIVATLDAEHLLVQRSNGSQDRLALKDARAFAVYENTRLTLSAGDKIRITQNGLATAIAPSDQDNAVRIDNGTLLTIASFTAAGDIVCTGGGVIDRNFGHLASGYCLTSHASQGKTVDHVLIAESSASAQSAGSLKQGYVSLSRGRESVRIYTDDRQAVEAAWTNTGERLSALELLVQQRRSGRRRTVRGIVQMIAARLARRVKQVVRRGFTSGQVTKSPKNVVHAGPAPRATRNRPHL